MGGTDAMLRPIDLARLAGVSTQQIRNYVDAGILPLVGRSLAGYRRFDARHRAALLAYLALSRGYGRDAGRAIMHAVHAGDRGLALALVDAGHAALHEERLSLRAAGEALEAVAAQKPDTAAAPQSGMRIGEVAACLAIRASALRVWESAGLLSPQREPGTNYRRFSPADLRDAQMINMLRQGRYPLPQIQPILDGLRRTGSSDALRAAIAQRHADLNARATAMLEGSCRLHGYLATGPSDPGEDKPAAPPSAPP